MLDNVNTNTLRRFNGGTVKVLWEDRVLHGVVTSLRYKFGDRKFVITLGPDRYIQDQSTGSRVEVDQDVLELDPNRIDNANRVTLLESDRALSIRFPHEKCILQLKAPDDWIPVSERDPKLARGKGKQVKLF